jgi:hypothetical protein
LFVNFSVQALAKVMGWQVLSASKVPQSLCLNFSVQALAKVMGWQVLSASNFLGCGSVEPFGSAAGCLLANTKGDRFLAIRHSPQINASIFLSQVRCVT